MLSNYGIAMIPLGTYLYKKHVLYVNILSRNLIIGGDKNQTSFPWGAFPYDVRFLGR